MTRLHTAMSDMAEGLIQYPTIVQQQMPYPSARIEEINGGIKLFKSPPPISQKTTYYLTGEPKQLVDKPRESENGTR